MTHSADNDAPVEPLLVSAMRRSPSGEVRHLPLDGRGMTGTTTRGFLRELDDYITAILAAQHTTPRIPLTCRVFGHNWEPTRDSVAGSWLFRCPKCRATTPISPEVSAS